MGNVLPGLLALLLIACNGGGSADDEGDENSVEKRCLRMRDHLIDTRLGTPATQPAGSSADSLRASSIEVQHRAALTAALGEDFAERCASSMSVAQIDCVLDADDNDAVAACTTSR